MAQQWSTALGATPEQSDTCDQQGERMKRIFELAKKSSENEAKAIQQLDEAVALAEKCTGTEQSAKIRQLMESSQSIAARMMVDAAQARGDNNRIGPEDEAGLTQRLAAAQKIRDRVLANKIHLTSHSHELQILQDEMRVMFSDYLKARAVAVAHMGLIKTFLPDRKPSELYEMEYFDANAKEARLRTALEAFPEVLECRGGEAEASKVLTAELAATKMFGDFDARQITLRDETISCPGVERQNREVDTMDASANWVQAAVEINSPLLTKICVPKNEPVTIACNTTTKAGTNPPQTIIVNVGNNAGTAFLQYQMFDVPDQMSVQYGGQTLADTGCVSGTGNLPLALSGASGQVTIVVNPACRKSEQTQWNFTLSCPSLNQTGAASATTTPSGGPTQLKLETVLGQASITLMNAVIRQTLLSGSNLINGALLQTGSNGQVFIKSPQETSVVMGANSQLRIGDTNGGKQSLELLQGSLHIERRQSTQGGDDVLIKTPDGTVQATGTRYYMTRDERGTEVFVYEGTVHITGRYIFRTYAPHIQAGKPSPVREMDLQAGQ